MPWPATPDQLVAEQARLAAELPVPDWTLPPEPLVTAAFVAFERDHSGPGRAGEPAWAGAVTCAGTRLVAVRALAGPAGAPYVGGQLALRVGWLLEAAIRALPGLPDVVMVDGTGLDHPRGAGLAVHLGAVLATPTVGVTHRPLVAEGEPPSAPDRTAPVVLAGRTVGYWVVTRPGARPVVAHAGWRTSAEAAADLVLAVSPAARTPEPLRQARRAARTLRAAG